MYSFENRSAASPVWVSPRAIRSWRTRSPSAEGDAERSAVALKVSHRSRVRPKSEVAEGDPPKGVWVKRAPVWLSRWRPRLGSRRQSRRPGSGAPSAARRRPALSCAGRGRALLRPTRSSTLRRDTVPLTRSGEAGKECICVCLQAFGLRPRPRPEPGRRVRRAGRPRERRGRAHARADRARDHRAEPRPRRGRAGRDPDPRRAARAAAPAPDRGVLGRASSRSARSTSPSTATTSRCAAARRRSTRSRSSARRRSTSRSRAAPASSSTTSSTPAARSAPPSRRSSTTAGPRASSSPSSSTAATASSRSAPTTSARTCRPRRDERIQVELVEVDEVDRVLLDPEPRGGDPWLNITRDAGRPAPAGPAAAPAPDLDLRPRRATTSSGCSRPRAASSGASSAR